MRRTARPLRLSLAAAALALSIAAVARPAAAAPFDARRVPSAAQAVGHLDVEAFKRTTLYARVAAKVGPDAVSADIPAELRPLVMQLVGSARGVTFWMAKKDHGAIHVQTGAAAAVQSLLAGLPGSTITRGGHRIRTLQIDGDPVFVGQAGDTIVLSDKIGSVQRSLQTIAGKAKGLAPSSALARAAGRGVFFFAALGGPLLDDIKKEASSRTMQIDMRSLVIDARETGGELTLELRAGMSSAEGPQKAKSVVEGLRALMSLADDPEAVKLRPLIDRLKVEARGTTLEVTFQMKTAELMKIVESMN